MSRQFSGPALKAARLAAGLTPEQVAVAIGRSAWSIQSYELGRGLPPVPVLAHLADVLGVGIEDLFVTSGDQEAAGVA
ncbi:MAG: helix-turn-helix transcriptional regulator [Pseudonocardiaceae bacterium]